MANLTFYYSTMAAGKSTFCLQQNHSLKLRGFVPLLLKSNLDTRDEGVIKSRMGISAPCEVISPTADLINTLRNKLHGITHLLVDEAQFLSPSQAWDLSDIVDQFNIETMCFGLRTTYTGKLFAASSVLFAIADNLIELPIMDSDGNKAIMHLKSVDGKYVFNGDDVEVGGDEKYQSISRKKWKGYRNGRQ